MDPSKSWHGSKTSRRDILDLNKLKAVNIRLPIIVANRRWGFGKEFDRFLKFIVKYHFRNRTVGQKAPGQMESLMIKTGKLIAETNGTKHMKSLDEILAYLRENDIDDDDFQYRFARYEFTDHNIAKYVLYNIEEYLSGKKAVEAREDLSLEHILPENVKAAKGWNDDEFYEGADLAPRRIESYVHRIGNLTLLTRELNSALQDASFSKKCTGYSEAADAKIPEKDEAESAYMGGYKGQKELHLIRDTVLRISLDVMTEDDAAQIPEIKGDVTKWTASVIEKRSEIFARVAATIWDL